MSDLGSYCLIAALALSGYGLIASVLGYWRGQRAWIRSSENAVVAVFWIVLAASLRLWYLILTDRFEFAFVASVNSTTTPTLYKVTSFWGQQSGSLLLWLLILAFLSAVAVVQNRTRNRWLMPATTILLSGSLLFFALLVNLVSNPFEMLPRVPPDGTGLNPLLQNYWMAIHPPILYVGMISVTIPFAFSMGALMSGRLDTSWIPTTRRWSLVSWGFLTLGFTLGGVWAYEELGWGGYWAWDPVENASFMPWLALTAFLHSVMITEKKGMLKTWNFLLILLAFWLTIFGTFITRSGVVSSVHAFAQSNIGTYFVIFLFIITALGVFLISYRSKSLTSESRMRSFLSREASFLLNNWLFLAICFAVFWGTVYPMVAEALTGKKATVAAPWFNEVVWPLGLALLVLTGICPLIAWRKASQRNFRRNFLFPTLGGLATGSVAVALGSYAMIPLLFFSAAGFVAVTVFFEFFKGARARQAIRSSSFITALVDLTALNKRRYGGFIIHAGVILVFVGIVASSFFKNEQVFTVTQGESFQIGRYTLRLLDLQQERDPEKLAVVARLDTYIGSDRIGRLSPQLHHHFKQDQNVSEVAVRSTVRDDLYAVLSGWDDDGNVSLRIFINPLVQLIWIGIGVMVAGGLFVLIPDRKPLARAVPSRERERSKGAEATA